MFRYRKMSISFYWKSTKIRDSLKSFRKNKIMTMGKQFQLIHFLPHPFFWTTTGAGLASYWESFLAPTRTAIKTSGPHLPAQVLTLSILVSPPSVFFGSGAFGADGGAAWKLIKLALTPWLTMPILYCWEWTTGALAMYLLACIFLKIDYIFNR